MTTLREAAQQALEAMSSFESGTNGLYEGEFAEEIAALRAALAENYCDNHCTWLDHAPGCVRAKPQTWVCPDSAEHRYGKSGHCEDCGKTLVQVAEPVQEPVAWRFQSAVGGWAYGSQPPLGSKYPAYPLYAAPPQRKPLTEEEIKACEKQAMVNGALPFEQRMFFARAIERAHGIGESNG